MIVRIVKLSIRENHRDDFFNLFEKNKAVITSFKGCIKVELLKDISNRNIFFTYSHWEEIDDLENYRESKIFKSIWEKTKSYFCDKPEAWSLKKM
jgi:quinol monooxygenase YgiN